MDIKVLCIFATFLLVSAGALRLDQGPQKFYETSPPESQPEQRYENKEIVLYLTPRQVKALEASGAVVRSAEPESAEEESPAEAPQESQESSEEEAEQESEEEQSSEEQSDEQSEEQSEEQPEEESEEQSEEQPEQEEEPAQPEQPAEPAAAEQAPDFDLDEILRILNEQEKEDKARAAEATEAPKPEEKATEAPREREIPPRFKVRTNPQKGNKYLAPSVAKKEQSKKQKEQKEQNDRYQKAKLQFLRQQQLAKENEEKQLRAAEEAQTPAPEPQNRYKLVPYEVEEKPEESSEEAPEPEQEQEQEAEQPAAEENEEESNNLPPEDPEKLAEVISQHKQRLFRNELQLQAVLRELKKSPKHNDQKFTIEIEKLKSNLEKQNALAKAEAIAKSAPALIKQELRKRRPNQPAKIVKEQSARYIQGGKPSSAPLEVLRPLPVPIVKTRKVEVPKPVPVPVEKRVPVTVTKKVYVKVDKPYIVERIVPIEIKKEVPVEIPIHKPERITILRHIWEH